MKPGKENAVNLLKKRPLAAALFLFFAGFFLLSILPFLAKAILFGVALSVGLFLLFCRNKRPFWISASFLLALAALLSVLSTDLPDYQIRIRKNETARYTFRLLEQTDEEKNVWTLGSVKDENGGVYCRLTVDLPDGTEWKIGDKLAGEGTVTSLSAFARNGLYGRGCRGKLTLSGEVEAIGHTPSIRAPFTNFAKTVRETLSDRVAGEDGGLLVAVLLGETDELPTGTGLLFRRAGVSHALAVSGMHLVFLSAALAFLLRRVGFPRPAVSVFVILFAFFYAALVGFTPSVVRAALMLFFYEGSWFVKRQADSLTSLALSGAVMLLFAPHLISSVSFLLSYLATLGVLLAAQICRAPIRSRSPLQRTARRIGSYALMTLFAVLFTLPVSCAIFGEVSLLSLPANLLLSLPIQLLLYLAVAVLILPFPFVGALAERYAALFLSLLRKIASLPLSPLTFSSSALAFFGTIPFVTLLAVAFLSLGRRKRAILVSSGAVVTVAAFLILALPISRAGRAVLLSDQKDNDLILLRTGTAAACVDLGAPDGVLSMLSKELKADRISTLDRYVFTAYDEGATDGFCRTLSSVYVRRVILTAPAPSEQAEYDALVSLLESVSVPYTTVSNECELLGYGIRVAKYDPADGAPTVPLTVELQAKENRLYYLGENVRIKNVAVHDGTTALFLGCHGETPYLAYRMTIPQTVETLFSGGAFYELCEFSAGTDFLTPTVGKRLSLDGWEP